MSRRAVERAKEAERLRLAEENPTPPPAPEVADRIAVLENKVAALSRENADLKSRLHKNSPRPPTHDEIIAAFAASLGATIAAPRPPRRKSDA